MGSKNKTDGNSQRGIQSQSTASAAEQNTEKYIESESQSGANAKLSNLTSGKDQSIDYKETNDNNNSGTAFKTFSFVSVVMEPCKKNTRSMKARDKNKPIIDEKIISKQINYMAKLLEYQKQAQQPLPIEFDEMHDYKLSQTSKRRKKASKDGDNSKIIRGNLGFCYLDMSLVNLCGVPSLWMDQHEFANSGSKITHGEN